MRSWIRRAASAALVATAVAASGASVSAAELNLGSTVVEVPDLPPVYVPVPLGSETAPLPPLPFPFEWQFHLSQTPAPAPAPAPAPKYGDRCLPEQVYEVHDRTLVCVYAGAEVPSWVFVAEEALNPDGTLNLDYPAG